MYINFRTNKSDAERVWEGIVDTKTGAIIARSCTKHAHPHEKRLNINDKITRQFPYSDEDAILKAAREALKEVKQ